MKKRIIFFISVLLVICLILILLASCGEGNSTTAITTESTVETTTAPTDEVLYPIEEINKANALLDEALNAPLIESYYTYSSNSLFFRTLEEKSAAYAELTEMDCFYYAVTKRHNELQPIHETLSAEEKMQYLVLSDLVACFDSIYNQN